NETCSTYICNSGGIIEQIGTICNTSVIPTSVNGGWTDWQNPIPVVCSATWYVCFYFLNIFIITV
ncbi:unnamed protein product, partial [Rotaria sp. Silwood1]